jgi:hypothetical protein
MARMNVIFKDSLLAEMRALVPVRQRRELIEEAVQAAIEETAGAWSNEDRDDPSLEIQRTRQAWTGREPSDASDHG